MAFVLITLYFACGAAIGEWVYRRDNDSIISAVFTSVCWPVVVVGLVVWAVFTPLLDKLLAWGKARNAK